MKTTFLILLSILQVPLTYAKDSSILLEGTIGTYPIVLQLTNGGDAISAVYYYKSSKKDINLSGTLNSGIYTLYAVQWNNKKGEDDSVETFAIKQETDKEWTGTWNNSQGKRYSVALSPVDPQKIKHPFSDLPIVQKMKKENDIGYLRSSDISIIKDSVKQAGKYTLEYCHINKTPVSLFKIISGLDKKIIKKINALLINSMIEHSENYFSCNSMFGISQYNYQVTNTYFTDNIISIERSIDWDCGGAHPGEGDDPININTNDGKEFALDDLLHFTGHPVPKEQSDAWLEYRDKEFTPKLVHLLTGLYPKEMKKPEKGSDDCDYSDKDVWEFSNWYFTNKGLYLIPDFPHVAAPCRDAEWSIIPYNVVKQYLDPNAKITLPK